MNRHQLDPDTLPPSNLARMREIGGFTSRLWRGIGHVGPRGPEDGPRCLVIPGFLATDRTAMELRRAFAEAGWRSFGWDAGLNKGARHDTVERLRKRLDQVSEGGRNKVLLVGWSLGGVFARELAHDSPDKVAAVVSLGSPISGDPRWNNVWRLYEFVAGHPVDAPPIDRVHDKPPVPTLALWSRKDGIVAPRAARGLPGESDSSVEIGCSHMDFAVGYVGTRRVVAETCRFLDAHGIVTPSARSPAA